VMGYALGTAPCIGCGQPFTFNPMKVPSIRVNDVKEPICENCVNRFNPIRIAKGLEPIVPLPGAYEACDEEELA